MHRHARTALALGLALSLSSIAHAAELPSARSLIDAHIAAVGGRDAIAESTDGTIKATLEIVEAGMKGDISLYSLGADHLMTLNLPAAGETKTGYVGGVAWSINAMAGPRILQGAEREQLIQQYDPKFAMRDATLLASATTTALSDSEGRPCYRVELKWTSGQTTADCYSTENGLLLSTESTIPSPMGELKQISHLSDYAPFGKYKIARTTRMKVAGMTQIIRIESIEATRPSADLFVLPAAIQALLKKAAAATPAAASAPAETSTSSN